MKTVEASVETAVILIAKFTELGLAFTAIEKEDGGILITITGF